MKKTKVEVNPDVELGNFSGGMRVNIKVKGYCNLCVGEKVNVVLPIKVGIVPVVVCIVPNDAVDTDEPLICSASGNFTNCSSASVLKSILLSLSLI